MQDRPRVAANVMRILAREIAFGPRFARAEWQRLDGLLGAAVNQPGRNRLWQVRSQPAKPELDRGMRLRRDRPIDLVEAAAASFGHRVGSRPRATRSPGMPRRPCASSRARRPHPHASLLGGTLSRRSRSSSFVQAASPVTSTSKTPAGLKPNHEAMRDTKYLEARSRSIFSRLPGSPTAAHRPRSRRSPI